MMQEIAEFSAEQKYDEESWQEANICRPVYTLWIPYTDVTF